MGLEQCLYGIGNHTFVQSFTAFFSHNRRILVYICHKDTSFFCKTIVL